MIFLVFLRLGSSICKADCSCLLDSIKVQKVSKSFGQSVCLLCCVGLVPWHPCQHYCLLRPWLRCLLPKFTQPGQEAHTLIPSPTGGSLGFSMKPWRCWLHFLKSSGRWIIIGATVALSLVNSTFSLHPACSS